MPDIYTFLEEHRIPYQRFDHPAVFTCEESARLCPDMPGVHTKNLFLRDGKGKRNILVVVRCEKNVDLKALRKILEADKLSFASPERLKEFLGVEPGSVTLLGLIHDEENQVEVVFDKEILEADALQCHPLVNTASLVISHEGIEQFLKATEHAYRVVVVPGR